MGTCASQEVDNERPSSKTVETYKEPEPATEEDMLRQVSCQKAVSPPRKGERVKFAVTSVHDGDTIKGFYLINAHGGRMDVSIRLEGIDTPELTVPEQRPAALVCKNWLCRVLDFDGKSPCIVDVDIKRWDKFGGRVVGRVFQGDTDVCGKMLELQLAQPHNGRTKKDVWPAMRLQYIVETYGVDP
jgi:endonuclease YncB( thermonuclease family)